MPIWPSCNTPAAPPGGKGAMLTHRNMQANLEQAKAAYLPLFRKGRNWW